MDKPQTPPIRLAAKDGQPVSASSPRPKLAARKKRRLKSSGYVGKAHKWEPTRAERKLICVALAAGQTQEQVAAAVGVNLKTLRGACRKELKDGAAGVNAKVAGRLFQKAMGGDTIAMIYWTKTRMGWSEKHVHELTGKDGGPIRYEQIQAEAEAFTQRIASMADRFTATMTSNADETLPANDGELTQKSTG